MTVSHRGNDLSFALPFPLQFANLKQPGRGHSIIFQYSGEAVIICCDCDQLGITYCFIGNSCCLHSGGGVFEVERHLSKYTKSRGATFIVVHITGPYS